MATYGKMVVKIAAGQWGWEEEWYWRIAADAASILTLKRDAGLYVKARLKFLADLWAIKGAFVALTDFTGASFTTGVSLSAYASVNAGPGKAPAVCVDPWKCLNMIWYAGNHSYHRNFLIRGMPDPWLCIAEDDLDAFTPSPNMKAAMSDWIEHMTEEANPNNPNRRAGEWGLRVLDRGKTRGEQVRIVAVEKDAGGLYTITTSGPILIFPEIGPPVAAVVGDPVHVHAGRNPTVNGLTGDWVVIGTPGLLQYKLNARQCVPCAPVLRGDPVAWGINYVFQPVTDYDFVGITSRPTGGPIGGTRGRRRACRR